MKTLYLATSKETPESIDKDDAYLISALEGIFQYKIIPWGTIGPIVDAPVLIRSTWDYHTDIKGYLEWAKKVPTIFNPFDIISWNCDKSYLIELGQIVNTIPTIKLAKGGSESIRNILVENNWSKAIIKPSISLGSLDTLVIENYDDLEADKLRSWQNNRDFMLQPFIKEITTAGEISIIYIDGNYSHAVRKVPKSGDFRSQPEFGSTVTLYNISEYYLAECQKIMDYITSKFGLIPPLYARIDFIDAAKPLLIELEMIEPCLYFKCKPDAAEKLVNNLCARLNNK